ncbi:MAG: glycosyltransferase family 39 protein [Anaerolineales bacterium]|nr:glycosyltransferase family 39 protein [Anaerolineales bacterium]
MASEKRVSGEPPSGAARQRWTSSRWAQLTPQAVPVLLVVLFALTVLLFFPFRFAFELDPDEGIQLMKAFLHAAGHPLYSQVYSDQPPLFTLLLSSLIKAFGAKVLPARLAVLFFSIILLTSAAEHLRQMWSWKHSAAAVVLLVLVPTYAQLSVSVMVGLPAISLAMLSVLFLTLWHKRPRPYWLVLSALALAASVMVKLFTVVLVPALVAGLLAIPRPNGAEVGGWRGGSRGRAASLWSAVFVGMLGILVTGLVGLPQIGQLVETHLGVRGIAYFEAETLLRHTRDLWPVFLLALIGTAFSVRRKAWPTLYFAAWVVLGGVLLAVSTPVWYHQPLLVAAPACVLAGVAVIEPLRGVPWRARGRWGAKLLALGVWGTLGVYLLWAGPRFIGKLRADMPNLQAGASPQTREFDLLTLIEYFDPDGGFLITDRPMFAFRSRREIPPELANLSQKVLRSGVVSEQRIIDLIRTSESPLVLLARFELPEVEDYLGSRYDQVYGYVELRLFVKP